MDDTRRSVRCPRCGRELPADAPAGLCAACLLATGVDTLTQTTTESPTMLSASLSASDSPTILSAASASGARPVARVTLIPGQPFGPYRIGRLLGRGGMGEVYEAEHTGTGRRVALKVLRAQLSDLDDRARFLHEGQLAASVSHPHTVYIFGSEEISGMPVITMELLPGGTLRDRVVENGPMAPADAVTAVLDIIGGLDAAHAVGILHRDIKPSNCFLDVDGGVKVGDFGLSISTLARDVQSAAMSQGFQGTPQFAAPEQLRGEPLDVRADIYAVGATLFYLITGAPPFEARDLGELVKRVTTEPPSSPRVKQPKMPKALAAIILQCLAKDPRKRPASYAGLADLLRPFASTAAPPAPVGSRFIAGIVDGLIISLPFTITSAVTISAARSTGSAASVQSIWPAFVSFVYYVLLEGRWGASLGKRLFRMRVVARGGGAASWRQILLRTFVNTSPVLPTVIPYVVMGEIDFVRFLNQHLSIALVLTLSNMVLPIMLFVTMRRSNGWAAIHDLVSGTRVVTAVDATFRRRQEADAGRTEAAVTLPAARQQCGPFDIVADLGAVPGGRLLDAFDPVLRRRVWIRAVPDGTPSITDARRDVGRVGRLHWLAGRRAPGENWDAFEAPDGRPWQSADRHVEWAIAKRWLMDLVTELEASAHDGSSPDLDLDRVWIRADDRAVLLDFPAPGALESAADRVRRRDRLPGTLTPAELLAGIGREGFAASDTGDRSGTVDAPTSAPLSALSLVERWTREPALPIARAREELTAVMGALDRVPRLRRAILVTVAAMPMILLVAGGLSSVRIFFANTTPERVEMLTLLSKVQQASMGHQAFRDDQQQRDAETYLIGTYGRTLADPAAWTLVSSRETPALRAAAADVLTRHPNVSDDETRLAAAHLVPELQQISDDYQRSTAPMLQRGKALMIAALVCIAGVFSLVLATMSTVIRPGGLVLSLLGLAAVTRDGRPITRARSLVRVIVIWLPLIVGAAWTLRPGMGGMLNDAGSLAVTIVVVLAVLAAGAVWTIVRPARGPHDWIARTWVVPR